jgi:hypothetical protein
LRVQVAGVSDAGLKPRKVARVAVLGGGLMGSGIATALVLAGVDVLLKEVNQQFLDVSVACMSDLLFLGSWLPAVGFAQLNRVRPASRVLLRQVTENIGCVLGLHVRVEGCWGRGGVGVGAYSLADANVLL